jgi:hypothetical protein
VEHAYWAGIVITVFLVLILIGKKNKSVADNLLAIWLCVIGCHLGMFYLFFTQKYIRFPWFLGFEGPMPLFQGPFLYAYTAALSGQILSARALRFHFGLPLLWYLPYLPFLMLPVEQKIAVYQKQGFGYEQLTMITVWAIKISGIVYVVLSLRLLRGFQKTIRDQFSNTEKINLHWLRYLILGCAQKTKSPRFPVGECGDFDNLELARRFQVLDCSLQPETPKTLKNTTRPPCAALRPRCGGLFLHSRADTL